MASAEFSLIERFFDRPSGRADVLLAVGDDCALLKIPESHTLAVSVDTLVSGIHFFPDVAPNTLGHKALAVNLSDLAATGAKPAWCTLSLTLPNSDAGWLHGFSEGFFSLASEYGVALVGGDTTQGPLSITVQVMGHVSNNQALLRSGAKPGDLIYVSGEIGSAGLGLLGRQGIWAIQDADIYKALETPTPRVPLGLNLVGLASACIDISDGLAADLGHILSRSGVGAEIDYDRLPLAASVQNYIEQTGDYGFPLTSGDDYELCFTVPPEHQSAVERLLQSMQLKGTLIGQISMDPGLRIKNGSGDLRLTTMGYEHFHEA